MTIFAIDPGSRQVGWAVIQGNQPVLNWQAGVWVLPSGPIENRLGQLFNHVTESLNVFQPSQVVIEQIYVRRDPHSSFVLGQAPGVVLAACGLRQIPVEFLSPAQARKRVLQSGNVTKAQVQAALMRFLPQGFKLQGLPLDASDALLLALAGFLKHQTGLIQWVTDPNLG